MTNTLSKLTGLAVVLLVLDVLPGPDVLSGHAASAICYDRHLLAQGTRKLGLNSPEVRGAERSGVGRARWREVASTVHVVEPGRPGAG